MKKNVLVLVSMKDGAHGFDTENQEGLSCFLDSNGNSNKKKRIMYLFVHLKQRKLLARRLRHFMLEDHLCLGFWGTGKDTNPKI